MEKKHEFDKLNWRDALPPTVEVGGKDCPNRLAVYRLADSSSENDPQRASILEHIASCSHCRPTWEAAQRVEAQAIAHDPADMIDRIHDYYGTTSQPLAADARMAEEFSNFEIEPIRWLEGNQGARVGVIPSYRSAVLVIDQTHLVDQAAKATVTISFGDDLDEVVLLPDQFRNDLYLWNPNPAFVQATITVRVNGTAWSSVLLDRGEFEPDLLFLAVICLPLDADDIWEKLASLDDRVFQLQQVGSRSPSDKSTSEHPNVAVHICSSWQLPAERQVAATVTSPLEVGEYEWRLEIELADNALDGATVRLMANGAMMGIATVKNRRISWCQKWSNQRVPKNLFHSLEIVLLKSSKEESRSGYPVSDSHPGSWIKTISDLGRRLGATGTIEFSLALLDRITSRLVKTQNDKEVARAACRRRLAEVRTLDPKTLYDVTIEINREFGSGNFSLADFTEDFIRSSIDFARRSVREMYRSLSTSEMRAFDYVFERVDKLPSINEVSINSMECPSEIAIKPFELAKLRVCNMWSSHRADLRRRLID